MRLIERLSQPAVSSTIRIEYFSDAVMAIIITLLVLELEIPEQAMADGREVLQFLRHMLPSLGAFAFSFLTIAVFWVNHHHFFHELARADWRLLWWNNHLLFWLALVPFTSALLGRNLLTNAAPAVSALYCFVLFMAALSFMLMSRHALFVADLLDDHITQEQRIAHYRHGWTGVWAYGLATILALIFLPGALVLMLAIPIFYLVPNLMHDHEAMS